MLGIAVATIRNWEERYATIVPERSPGGHRLYSRDDVEQLRFIAAEVSGGLSAADAHRVLAERSESGQVLRSDGSGAGTRLLVLVAERDPVAADLTEAPDAVQTSEAADIAGGIDGIAKTDDHQMLRRQYYDSLAEVAHREEPSPPEASSSAAILRVE